MEKEVAENLWNGDREAQIQVAMEPSRLSSKQRHKLAESSVIVPLVSMLHSENYEAIDAAALCALLGLAFGSELNKIRIIKSGVSSLLLNLFHCQCQSGIIGNSSHANTTTGVITPLLELIHNSLKSSLLVEKAIGLLESIVSSSESALCEARIASIKCGWNTEGKKFDVASEGLFQL